MDLSKNFAGALLAGASLMPLVGIAQAQGFDENGRPPNERVITQGGAPYNANGTGAVNSGVTGDPAILGGGERGAHLPANPSQYQQRNYRIGGANQTQIDDRGIQRDANGAPLPPAAQNACSIANSLYSQTMRVPGNATQNANTTAGRIDQGIRGIGGAASRRNGDVGGAVIGGIAGVAGSVLGGSARTGGEEQRQAEIRQRYEVAKADCNQAQAYNGWVQQMRVAERAQQQNMGQMNAQAQRGQSGLQAQYLSCVNRADDYDRQNRNPFGTSAKVCDERFGVTPQGAQQTAPQGGGVPPVPGRRY